MVKTDIDYSHSFWQTDPIRLCALTTDDTGFRFTQYLDSISREEFTFGIELPTTAALQSQWLEQHDELLFGMTFDEYRAANSRK